MHLSSYSLSNKLYLWYYQSRCGYWFDAKSLRKLQATLDILYFKFIIQLPFQKYIILWLFIDIWIKTRWRFVKRSLIIYSSLFEFTKNIKQLLLSIKSEWVRNALNRRIHPYYRLQPKHDFWGLLATFLEYQWWLHLQGRGLSCRYPYLFGRESEPRWYHPVECS